ncbi:MAG: putative transporter [Verrucomicrobiales bacterium]|nr:putative transporter [Verrucomicrobiales bacterium]
MHPSAVLAAIQPTAAALMIVSLVAAAGISIGTIRFRGIRFGSAGVLFAGLLAGHLGLRMDHALLQFLQEFGLVLFVYTIGLQMGPGFFTSLRKQGLSLNLQALAIVALGVALTVGLAAAMGMNLAAAAGLFAGATTNTPALGAAQDSLRATGASPHLLNLPGVGYAIAYPGGIAGIIGSMLILKAWFRIDPEREAAAFREQAGPAPHPPQRLNVEVTNANLDGLPIREIPGWEALGVIVSRIRGPRDLQASPATGDTVIRLGDILLAVGTPEALRDFQRIVGRASSTDLMHAPGNTSYRRVLVTQKSVLGRTVRDLNLEHRFNVTVTRVTRADLEVTAVPGLAIQFGDMLQLVGTAEHLDQAAAYLGNSLEALNQTNFVPIFLGIAAGILAGLCPIAIPGLPVSVHLGLAGGPLLLALILSRIGRIGRLVWYMPANANLAFRELGIVLFLACVGLKSGESFVRTLLSPAGLQWAAAGIVITALPLLLMGIFSQRVLRQNYITTCGVIAGSMTDPPALAFANNTARSDSASIAYATVYPLTMILRIVAAQVMAMMAGS